MVESLCRQVILSSVEKRAAGSRAALVGRTAIHATVFHSIATMLIPALLIHEAVHYAALAIKALGASDLPYARW